MIFDTYQDSKGNVYKLTTEVEQVIINDMVDLTETIERLNKKIEQYENPEDMTLMFMWCDEKAKDEIKRLHTVIKEVREYIEDNSFLDWTLGINTELGELKLRQKELLEILDKEKQCTNCGQEKEQ